MTISRIIKEETIVSPFLLLIGYFKPFFSKNEIIFHLTIVTVVPKL